MNYLSEEWVQEQLDAFDQHKLELVRAVGELREAAKLVAQLRDAVDATHGDAANLGREVAATRISVMQLKENVATHVATLSTELGAAVRAEVDALIEAQAKELVELRAIVDTLRAESEVLQRRLEVLETPQPVQPAPARTWLPTSLDALKAAIARTRRGGS